MKQPLVSVIIPCFNYGRYLPDALDSVRAQDYPNVEVIVVDDGSADNTKEVCDKYPEVKYVYQTNQGLSAARNTGIRESAGEFLIFLDADDWLLPDAITSNLNFILQHPEELAFVSGAYEVRYTHTGRVHNAFEKVGSDHYLRLLTGNYVGVPATVLYRRRVFDEIVFDPELKSCQDYDLYLKITRKYPVSQHSKKIAVYRIHAGNMSADIPAMLAESLSVLRNQKKYLQKASEKRALQRGRIIWKNYYCEVLYEDICSGTSPASLKNVLFFIRHRPRFLFLLLISFLNHVKLSGFDGIRFFLKKSAAENGLIRLKVRWLKHDLYLRRTVSDLSMFHQIFVAAEDKSSGFDFDPKIIIDCGANIGLESVYFANKFPQALIYCFEPDREKFEVLLKNTERYSRIKCFDYGIWNESSVSEVKDSARRRPASDPERTDQHERDPAAAITIEEIMKRHEITGIDICKINIAGAEKELFAGNPDRWLSATRAVMIRLHDRLKEGCSKSFFDALADYDFDVFPSGPYLVCILRHCPKD